MIWETFRIFGAEKKNNIPTFKTAKKIYESMSGIVKYYIGCEDPNCEPYLLTKGTNSSKIELLTFDIKMCILTYRRKGSL